MKWRSRFLSKSKSRKARNLSQRGFTFIEVLVSVGVIGILAGSSIWAMTQINNYASIARLRTGAETVAQNRIDEILSESPFNPQKNPAEVPSVLTVGTTTDAKLPEIYNEPNPAGGSPRVIYGTLTTTVSKMNVTGLNGQDLNLYSATVVVSYIYRGKTYQVQFNALRSSDV